ncbi:MAG: cob(I)yrinic acid a,c-diamide adenosyltransferase [Paludibacter sp.]|nr:cob(I)yrinic acid a,c-diamide adenosyltransferase [Paludibacter sp.]
MKIYTKTGDKGTTGLIGGTRIPKNDIRLEAYGTVDELNSFIGLLKTFSLQNAEENFLFEIQNKLFSIGSYLATDTSKTSLDSSLFLTEQDVISIENEIDRLNEKLPPLSNFILPGGTQSAAVCHICRTVSRRAERRIFDVSNLYSVDNHIYMYVNRLSDYFFVLSRYINITNETKEIYWKK